ncbi:MAG: fluoride efflux transporter CrcB [Isosphaeraceae bacterium]
MKFFLVAVAGGVGSGLRYLLAGWVQRIAGGPFPLGVLVVNLIGCLLIGFVGTLIVGTNPLREEYRLLLMVGLLGGFTTFSSFAWDTTGLWNDGRPRLALANIVAGNGGGFLAVWIGIQVGTRLLRG